MNRRRFLALMGGAGATLLAACGQAPAAPAAPAAQPEAAKAAAQPVFIDFYADW